MEVARIDSSGQLDTFLAYPSEFLDDIFTEKMDSMSNSWFIRNAYNIDDRVTPDSMLYIFNLTDSTGTVSDGKALPDSIYIQRLAALNSAVDLSYNNTVKNMIVLYTEKRKGQMETMLGLANYYFPMFEEILDKYDMPLELKYMAIVESALNAKALSRAGACGLWQFMYGTGKMYGLEITSFIDERRDPLKSTEAAARYLNDLYNIYNDWHLVIAAYNCGPGNVNKAIRRSGGARDYWTIYYRLPRETRGYVPAFIAATYAMNYYKLHGLSPKQPSFNIISDTIMVSDYLHLEQVAFNLGLEIDMLREINPMYRRDVLPATNQKPYPLRLPRESVGRFIDIEQDIFTYKRDDFFPNNEIKNPTQTAYQYTPVDIQGKAIVNYTVKAGDNVGFISEWFKVRASDLRYWNNIRGNLIRVGQKLTVYVPESQAAHFRSLNTMSFDEKQKSIGKTTSNSTTAKKENIPLDPSYEYYTVKRGDNLWDISRRYPGISAGDIQKLNNISNATSLYIGQNLKIRKK
jgi:membrane-bound lytic murein transglycosylase D